MLNSFQGQITKREIDPVQTGSGTQIGRLLVFLIGIGISVAQAWVSDPAVNTAIAEAPLIQISPDIVADGTGGTFIVWRDDRDGSNTDIYAQHIDANGKSLWAETGVKVADTNSDFPQVVLDGNGGIIVVWINSPNSDPNSVLAQRLNSAGVIQWATNGIALDAPSTKDRLDLGLISDGSGGAIAAWNYEFDLGDGDIYAQRINNAGVTQWGLNTAMAISDITDNATDPQLLGDGSGGAYFVWVDNRNGNDDIYAQYVSAAGAINWTDLIGNQADLAIELLASDQDRPQIVSDGQGGMFVGYMSLALNSINTNLYAQRVKQDKSMPWGVRRSIAATANARRSMRLVEDGNNGFVAAWWEDRQGSETGMYAQRFNNTGVTQWNSGLFSGLPISHLNPNLLNPDTLLLIRSKASFVAAWVSSGMIASDFYAQKFDMSGKLKWPVNDVLLAKDILPQYMSMTEDGRDGAVMAFSRSSTVPNASLELYAQRVYADGKLTENGMCFPIKIANEKVGIICL